MFPCFSDIIELVEDHGHPVTEQLQRELQLARNLFVMCGVLLFLTFLAGLAPFFL